MGVWCICESLPAYETGLILLSGWDCKVCQGVAKLIPLGRLLPTPSISVLKGVKHKVKRVIKERRGGGSFFMVAKSFE